MGRAASNPPKENNYASLYHSDEWRLEDVREIAGQVRLEFGPVNGGRPLQFELRPPDVAMLRARLDEIVAGAVGIDLREPTHA